MRWRCLARRIWSGEEGEGVRVDEEEKGVAMGSVALGSSGRELLSRGEVTLWPEGMLGRLGRAVDAPVRGRWRELFEREQIALMSSMETRANDCIEPGLRAGADEARR